MRPLARLPHHDRAEAQDLVRAKINSQKFPDIFAFLHDNHLTSVLHDATCSTDRRDRGRPQV
jgi:hypothetical protein